MGDQLKVLHESLSAEVTDERPLCCVSLQVLGQVALEREGIRAVRTLVVLDSIGDVNFAVFNERRLLDEGSAAMLAQQAHASLVAAEMP